MESQAQSSRLSQRRNGFVSAMLDEDAKREIASLRSFRPPTGSPLLQAPSSSHASLDALSLGEAVMVRQIASPNSSANSWCSGRGLLEKIPEEGVLFLTSADELEVITEDGNSVMYLSDDSSSMSLE
eukprot:TRINITY_DN25648_c0_g1_i1.p1 TRINITY_DN25648_c0_g1~~TRINITY_DN25648_c0_g1_i1.p1  ORF type:complete len:127 (-),score=29.71 TRINITY_DN25648_c0_g1_i1:75-455(-)